MEPRYEGAWALITGASAGLGAEFARALAARRCNLVLTARRVDRLEALAKELPVEAKLVPGDLAADGGARAITKAVDALGVPIEHFVNNAGFGSAGAFARSEPERQAEMVRVNCEALTVLSRHFLAPMVERRSGGVIHLASTAAFQPVPYMATYAATKAFVLSLSTALSEEVRGKGVRVLALCPGPVPTEFQQAAGIKVDGLRPAALDAEVVVRRALRAYDDGDDVLVPGVLSWLGSAVSRVVPRPILLRTVSTMMRLAGRRH